MLLKLGLYATLMLSIAGYLVNGSPAPLVVPLSLNSAELFKRAPIPYTTDPLCTAFYVAQEATTAQVCLSVDGENLVVT